MIQDFFLCFGKVVFFLFFWVGFWWELIEGEGGVGQEI